MADDEDRPDEVGRLLDELARWAARSRTEEAVGSRSRQAWLTRQSAEATTWLSLATGWAERGAHVQVTTTTGRVHLGRLKAVGRDFLWLSPTPGKTRNISVLVATAGIAFVSRSMSDGIETGPGRQRNWARPVGTGHLDPVGDPEGVGRPVGDPEGVGDLDRIATSASEARPCDLVGVLAELAPLRPRIRVVTTAGTSILGELRWVGVDVMCLRAQGSPPTPMYLRPDAVLEVSVLEV
ncbi:MAG: hypothetical protein ACRDX8_10860 [Acidimicrobiales bacterium]